MEKEKEQEEKKEKKTLRQRGKEIVDWAKAHKKELIIATGMSITALIGLITSIRSRNALEELFASFKKLIEKPVIITKMPEVIPVMQKQISEIQVDPSVESVSEQVRDVIAPVVKKERVPHDVRMHPRTLPANWKPSLEKINLAKDLGIDLAPNQTLVNSYRTGTTTV